MTFFALVLNRPMVLMCAFTPSSPSATIFAGVSAIANSLRVARLTETSVACAERRDRDQQGVGIAIFELGLRLGIELGETAEEFEDVGLLHLPPITSRIE